MTTSEWDGTPWAGDPVAAVQTRSVSTLEDFVLRLQPQRGLVFRVPSVRDAMGVPGILRAVTLIANTTGALTVQCWRNTALMDDTPQLVSRPDPYSTPRDFYRDSAYLLASRGETVWWIAKRDSKGYATALVVVPVGELMVEANPDNRLLPRYRWGTEESTRYSAANPRGDFVHVTYLKEPGALRGTGPLQYAGAAASVAVEAQDWAANFYAGGGLPSVVIKHADILSGEADADGLNEAERLRNQFMEKAHNTPRVIDQSIESIDYHDPTEAGAQMLQSRDYQNGEAARMFGIPGALMEYGVNGASLTYQNLADVWTNFLRGCLTINYLEPIEQALTDLLPRQQVARFLTEGLQRSDALTRWQIYDIATRVLGQEAAAELAAVGEGLAPGNPEVAPVPFAPPAAIPTSLPEIRSVGPVRCDGTFVLRRGGIPGLVPCRKLLAESGPFIGRCPRCKKEHAAA